MRVTCYRDVGGSVEVFGAVGAGAACAVMAAAGLWKIGRVSEVATAWKGHEILPAAMVASAARAVGPIELILAVGLVVPSTRSVAATLTVLLFGIYGVYLTAAVRRRAQGGCGCFGSDSTERVNVGHVARVVMFGAIAAVAALGESVSLQPAALIVGVAVGAALVGAGSILVALVDVSSRRTPRSIATP